jgi:hypothetical protein
MTSTRSIGRLCCADRTAIAAYCVAVMCIAGPARAVQHLVAAGESWQERAAKLRPGDEVILMPGKHKPGLIEVLSGTASRPITIRGVDSENPPEIEAEREGLRIRQASHIIIRDLAITGGSIAGITLGSSAGNPETDVNNILVKNVTVRRVGPKGQRHSLALIALNRVRVENCRFEGWSGAGIDVESCRDVKISNCSFTGLDEFGQLFGVRTHAGTRQVEIDHCQFNRAGTIALCLGGVSPIDDFRPSPATDASAGSLFEAAYVNVEDCIIVDAPCAVAYVSAGDCAVRRNTIVRPRRSVLAILAEHTDARIGAGRNNIFGGNIVAWARGDLKQYAEVSPKAETRSFSLETNLWWSPETDEERSRLLTGGKPQPGASGTKPPPKAGEGPGAEEAPEVGPMVPGARNEAQITRVDPRLNDRFEPTDDAAQAYGAVVP